MTCRFYAAFPHHVSLKRGEGLLVEPLQMRSQRAGAAMHALDVALARQRGAKLRNRGRHIHAPRITAIVCTALRHNGSR